MHDVFPFSRSTEVGLRYADALVGLRDRGVLREGAWADIAIFDPDTVIDKATFELPQQYAEGVHYVMVNGELVIDGGTHTEARPGAVVYGPGRAG